MKASEIVKKYFSLDNEKKKLLVEKIKKLPLDISVKLIAVILKKEEDQEMRVYLKEIYQSLNPEPKKEPTLEELIKEGNTKAFDLFRKKSIEDRIAFLKAFNELDAPLVNKERFLEEVLLKSTNSMVIATAISLLKNFDRNRRVERRVEKFLEHSDERVVANSIELLTEWGDKRVKDKIKEFVNSGDARIKAAAAMYFEKLGFAEELKEAVESLNTAGDAASKEALEWVADNVKLEDEKSVQETEKTGDFPENKNKESANEEDQKDSKQFKEGESTPVIESSIGNGTAGEKIETRIETESEQINRLLNSVDKRAKNDRFRKVVMMVLLLVLVSLGAVASYWWFKIGRGEVSNTVVSKGVRKDSLRVNSGRGLKQPPQRAQNPIEKIRKYVRFGDWDNAYTALVDWLDGVSHINQWSDVLLAVDVLINAPATMRDKESILRTLLKRCSDNSMAVFARAYFNYYAYGGKGIDEKVVAVLDKVSNSKVREFVKKVREYLFQKKFVVYQSEVKTAVKALIDNVWKGKVVGVFAFEKAALEKVLKIASADLKIVATSVKRGKGSDWKMLLRVKGSLVFWNGIEKSGIFDLVFLCRNNGIVGFSVVEKDVKTYDKLKSSGTALGNWALALRRVLRAKGKGEVIKAARSYVKSYKHVAPFTYYRKLIDEGVERSDEVLIGWMYNLFEWEDYCDDKMKKEREELTNILSNMESYSQEGLLGKLKGLKGVSMELKALIWRVAVEVNDANTAAKITKFYELNAPFNVFFRRIMLSKEKVVLWKDLRKLL